MVRNTKQLCEGQEFQAALVWPHGPKISCQPKLLGQLLSFSLTFYVRGRVECAIMQKNN